MRHWRGKRAMVLTAALAFGLGWWPASPAWAEVSEITCPFFYRAIEATFEKKSTTSLRKEEKVVLTQRDAEAFLDALRKKFPQIKLREEPLPGTQNVTVTDYARDILLPTSDQGFKRKAKIRVRKYGWRQNGASEDSFNVADAYKEVSKFEFKIGHPDHDAVVFKPGILLKDSDLELALEDRATFLRNLASIRANAHALNPKDPALVDEMLAGLRQVYDEMEKPGSRGEFPEGVKRLFRVEYERDAFEVKVPDAGNPTEPTRVQFTFDKSVRFRQPDSNAVVAGYPDDWRVLEVKVPLELAQLSDADLAKRSPELLEVRKLVRGLNQVSEVPRNSGKAGGMRRIIDEELVAKGGVDTSAEMDELIRFAADYSGLGGVSGTKQQLLEKMANTPMGDYRRFWELESRKINGITVKVPKLSKDGKRRLMSDMQIYADLEISQLEAKKARKVLSPEGAAYLDLLVAWKRDQRRSVEAWLAIAIDDKATMLYRTDGPEIGFGRFFQALFDDYLIENGSLVSQKGFFGRIRDRIDDFEGGRARKNVEAAKRFAKDRWAKAHVGYIVVAPTAVLGLAGYQACVYLGCPFDSEAAGRAAERADRRKRAAQLREQTDGLAKLVDRVDVLRQQEGATAAATYAAVQNEMGKVGATTRRALLQMSQKDPEFKERLREEADERLAAVNFARKNLELAKAGKDRDLLAARVEEYSNVLALYLTAESFFPSLGETASLPEADRSLRDVDMEVFLGRSLSLLTTNLYDLRRLARESGSK